MHMHISSSISILNLCIITVSTNQGFVPLRFSAWDLPNGTQNGAVPIRLFSVMGQLNGPDQVNKTNS